MAPYDDTTAATRFDSFHVYETHFKQIGDHHIKVSILVPKELKPAKVPLAVKFHGGGLVTGDAMFPDWFAAYWVPLMHRNNAISVLPNYRLVPEASAADILEDLADFWAWLNDKGVDKFLASQGVDINLDYEHLFVSGESAGGWLAFHSAFTRPKGEIKAILVQYPVTQPLRRSSEDLAWGQQIQPKKWLDEKLAALIKPGAVVSSANPYLTDRLGLFFALNAHGRFDEFFGVGKHLWPITAVENFEFLPPTTIFHAAGDSVVRFQNSMDFVEKVQTIIPDVDIRLAYAGEGDHGFDGALKEDEEPWLKVELEWVESRWLA